MFRLQGTALAWKQALTLKTFLTRCRLLVGTVTVVVRLVVGPVAGVLAALVLGGRVRLKSLIVLLAVKGVPR